MKYSIATFFICLLLLSGCIETQSSKGSEQSSQTLPTTSSESGVDIEDRVISLFGAVLPEKQLSERIYDERLEKLETARENYEKDPENIENIIWYGRRLAYLGEYNEAIHIYSIGLDKDPDNYKLLRHRGHRYITIRKFDKAIEDLQRAAFHSRPAKNEIEPDGLPNRLNKPLSNTKFNIWYHLGIAYYLKGNYDKAISSFKQCMEFCDNDDLLVANTNWFYMTYQKIGNKSAAEELLEPINSGMEIIEKYAYYQLLQMYRGDVLADDLLDKAERENNSLDPTLGYGLANWYLYNGQLEKGKTILDRILLSRQWDAFGYEAAEVDDLSLSNL